MEQDILPCLERLDRMKCRYAFYYQRRGEPPFFRATCEQFPSASIIKVPILLAWVELERRGEVNRDELCDLDAEPVVEGAGLSWLLRARRLPYQDVLLLMIALSDNLCTNLVVQRVGRERLNTVFREILHYNGVELQRKMMDLEARARGEDNWITAQDCIHSFELVRQLSPEEKSWVEPMLLANQDTSLFMRDLQRDTVSFYHKTGSLPGILHDWGYTQDVDLFLLTRDVEDEAAVNGVFGQLGLLLGE